MAKVVLATGCYEFKTRIKDMRIGEIAYTVPWAFNPKTMELDDNMTVSREWGGTLTLRVTKTILGYVVHHIKNDFEF